MMAIIIFVLIVTIILGYILYHKFDSDYEKDRLARKLSEEKINSIIEANKLLAELKILEESEEVNLQSAKTQRDIAELQDKIYKIHKKQEERNDNNATDRISK